MKTKKEPNTAGILIGGVIIALSIAAHIAEGKASYESIMLFVFGVVVIIAAYVDP